MGVQIEEWKRLTVLAMRVRKTRRRASEAVLSLRRKHCMASDLSGALAGLVGPQIWPVREEVKPVILMAVDILERVGVVVEVVVLVWV